jgi:hypothetical protein
MIFVKPDWMKRNVKNRWFVDACVNIYSLCPKINDLFDFVFVYEYTTLIANIFNYLLLIIIKIVYFENIRRDKSNNISDANICMYILVEKYRQSKLNE